MSTSEITSSLMVWCRCGGNDDHGGRFKESSVVATVVLEYALQKSPNELVALQPLRNNVKRK